MLKLEGPENVIDSFHGDHEFLSNFYPAMVKSGGLRFSTVEHAYQASKTNDHFAWVKISNMPASQAGKAKRMGRKLRMRKDWDVIKLSKMRSFLYQKFNDYDNLKQRLLATGDAMLIEGNHWHDNFWGNCKCDKCKHIEGRNHLGKLLMEIREKLK